MSRLEAILKGLGGMGIPYFIAWYLSAIQARKDLKSIHMHQKYYPKKFIMPGRRVRKIFKLEKKMIPKWIYVRFIMSFVFIGLYALFIVLILVLKDKALVVDVFLEIGERSVMVSVLWILIFGFFYSLK